jgi:hypothetical protein
LGAPTAPHGTGVVVPGWAEAAIAALKAENRHLRHELRAARVEAKENKKLRREELRLTVGGTRSWVGSKVVAVVGWGRSSCACVALFVLPSPILDCTAPPPTSPLPHCPPPSELCV